MNVKTILASTVLFLSMMTSIGAVAANYDYSSAKVTNVYVNTNGELLFKLTNHSFSVPLSCTKNNWYKINSTDLFTKQAIHKNLLTAKLTGNTVWLRANGCSYYPTVNIVSLNAS